MYKIIENKWPLWKVVVEAPRLTNEEALAAFPIQKLNKLEELISLIRYLTEPRDG